MSKTARDICLETLSRTLVRDLDYLVAQAQQRGADPAEARKVMRELLGLQPDHPSFRAIPAAKP